MRWLSDFGVTTVFATLCSVSSTWQTFMFNLPDRLWVLPSPIQMDLHPGNSVMDASAGDRLQQIPE